MMGTVNDFSFTNDHESKAQALDSLIDNILVKPLSYYQPEQGDGWELVTSQNADPRIVDIVGQQMGIEQLLRQPGILEAA